MSLEATIAANRFGMGARPGQIAQIGRDPKGWLIAQVNAPASVLINDPNLLSSQQGFEALADYREMRTEARRAVQAQSPVPEAGAAAKLVKLATKTIGPDTEARILHAVTTSAPFGERWAQFWSNHFTMAARNIQTTPYPGSFEREAIRPNVWGSFTDLLVAADTHIGMLAYLDQAQSIGPNSIVGSMPQRRKRDAGLNENLAREILELHTLGPDGGYRQTDVTEFAKALTGWTVKGPRLARVSTSVPDGTVIFVEQLHEPGARTIMGRSFPANGRQQALDILRWLASQPQVATRIAYKLAVHFVADEPPASLTTRLEATFIQTKGNLKALALTLINSPEAWTPQASKFKTPNDFLISTMRAGGATTTSMQALRQTFEQLGQTPWRAPSPKGWPDTAAAWAAPDAILKRVDWANLAGEVIAQTMAPMSFAENALGEALNSKTRTAISRAQTAQQGIVLALMSPEFQRR